MSVKPSPVPSTRVRVLIIKPGEHVQEVKMYLEQLSIPYEETEIAEFPDE